MVKQSEKEKNLIQFVTAKKMLSGINCSLKILGDRLIFSYYKITEIQWIIDVWKKEKM